jgi:hypothetical protein
MTEKKPGDLLSQLIPDQIEESLGLGEAAQKSQDSLLIALLKEAVSPNSGPLGELIDQFLDGKGVLHETTRTALARGPRSAQREVASFLSETLNLNAATAKVVASLLVRLFPALGKLGAAEEKAKPRRKKKPASSSSTKPKKKPAATAAKPKKPARKKTKREG